MGSCGLAAVREAQWAGEDRNYRIAQGCPPVETTSGAGKELPSGHQEQKGAGAGDGIRKQAVAARYKEAKEIVAAHRKLYEGGNDELQRQAAAEREREKSKSDDRLHSTLTMGLTLAALSVGFGLGCAFGVAVTLRMTTTVAHVAMHPRK